ncbi:MAG: TMEM14 family protein [Verrucomicrobiota bacterium]
MNPKIILWIYIALLAFGGLMGFLKAKSKVSLIMSLIFAALLSLYNLDKINVQYFPEILIGLLVVIFGIRLAKTKKFMPAGLMLVLSIAVLILRNLKF